MLKVTKAIFVVAGFGTRFLPATKAQPKEMLPIVNKPIIQYLVEEAVEAGITEIIFVTGRGKNAIENHFDTSYELEQILEKKNKHKVLSGIQEIPNMANFAYVRQPIQKGDGHALLCAKSFVDDEEPVMMIFPDYLMPLENKTLKKMVECYEKNGKTVIATDMVPMQKVTGYGVIDYTDTNEDGVMKINNFVEKPAIDKAPSNYINAGYAILTPDVWNYLKGATDSVGDGEIRVADAWISMLRDNKEIYAIKPDQPGYDCGSIIGFLKATVDFGLAHEDGNGEFSEFLKTKNK